MYSWIRDGLIQKGQVGNCVNDTMATEIYALSLHFALPISNRLKLLHMATWPTNPRLLAAGSATEWASPFQYYSLIPGVILEMYSWIRDGLIQKGQVGNSGTVPIESCKAGKGFCLCRFAPNRLKLLHMATWPTNPRLLAAGSATEWASPFQYYS